MHVSLLLYKYKVWIIYYYSASDLDLCCIYAVNTLIWFSVPDTFAWSWTQISTNPNFVNEIGL